MQIIVATDIHGINDDLKALFQDFGNEIKFLSPWNKDACPYDTEQEAAAAFHAKNGLATYQQKIAETVGQSPALLIGFSVGASSLWLHTASKNCHPTSYAQLFYGSRIRDHISLTPRCKTSLIFAEHESAFQPATLAGKIEGNNVECSIIKDTHHGFMNPRSPHFNETLAQQLLAQMKSSLMHYNDGK
jgi:dienelactone hydrolase